MLDGSALPLLFCGAVAAGIALVQWELMKAKQKAAMPKRIVLIRHGNVHWYYNKWVVLLLCSHAHAEKGLRAAHPTAPPTLHLC